MEMHKLENRENASCSSLKKGTVAMQEENKNHDGSTNVQNKLGRKV